MLWGGTWLVRKSLTLAFQYEQLGDLHRLMVLQSPNVARDGVADTWALGTKWYQKSLKVIEE